MVQFRTLLLLCAAIFTWNNREWLRSTFHEAIRGGEQRLPASFCTIATSESVKDAALLLFSLAQHHPGASVFVACDTIVLSRLRELIHGWNLNVMFLPSLDTYGSVDRDTMVADGKWTEFQMEKATVITRALEHFADTLFLDGDFVVLQPLLIPSRDPREHYRLGLSPHYIERSITDEYGVFNGGILWTRDVAVTKAWRKFAATSRYHDQAALEDLADIFDFFTFGLDINFSWWRFNSTALPITQRALSLASDGTVLIGDKPLRCFHTHFFSEDPYQLYGDFNGYILQHLSASRSHADLLNFLAYLQNDFDTGLPSRHVPNAEKGHVSYRSRSTVFLACSCIVALVLLLRFFGRNSSMTKR